MNDINSTLVRGENFVKLADHVLSYYDKSYSNPNDIHDGDTVYCDTRSLYKFHKDLMQHKDLVIITHNCIGPVVDGKVWRTDGVNTDDFEGCFRAWFAKNCYSKKEHVMPIPLGFENVRWDKNGLKRKTFNTISPKPPTKDVYLNCKIGTNTEHRQQCWDQCSKMKCVDLSGPNLPFDKFMNKMFEYKFIASPDGAGVDCHRTWEALYLNRVPVLKGKDPLHRLYKDLSVLFVDEWTDLSTMNLDAKYHEMLEKVNREVLTQKYWNNKILGK